MTDETSVAEAPAEVYSGLVAPIFGILGAVLRFPRSKCHNCHKRRVLFEVRITSIPLIPSTIDAQTLAASSRVCAVCANLR